MISKFKFSFASNTVHAGQINYQREYLYMKIAIVSRKLATTTAKKGLLYENCIGFSV